uniref:Putative chromosome segregation ATPase n=1 Tax=Arthrobacter sp. Chr15 TaxID=447032 RepID=A6YFP0_9MICC|nr:chromosome segregation ATPase [Arthrobacter sp. Chr15]ABR67051.1 putative chromosome segregation ATPase [Arthrobacter sp. Chr15]
MTETKRRRLANILPPGTADQEPSTPEQSGSAPDARESTPRNEASPAETPTAAVETPVTAPPSRPRFAEFERKEARLRQDQLDALDALARKIKRARKPGAGERITDNTLIRVAVDLLLARQDELMGSTEDELRTSVSL